MTKRWLIFALFGAFLYSIFLVVTIPATYLASGIADYTRGLLSVNNARGTVWHGWGELVVNRPGGSQAVGQGEWHINPLRLVSGKLGVSVDLTENGIDGRLNLLLGPGSIRLSNVDVSFPASLAKALYAPAALLDLGGDLHLTTPDFVLGRDDIAGNGEIRWANASSALSTVNPLGDYRLEMKTSAKELHIKCITSKGNLVLNGEGRWRLDSGAFQFSGNASAPGKQAELGPLLTLMTGGRGDGSVRFNGKFLLRSSGAALSR